MKRIFKYLLLLTALCCLFTTPAYAVFTKLGMAGMPFLKLGVGRAMGMGDAFVAIADDASASYWNPAGLALLKNRELLLNHIDWILETRHEYLTGAFPTKLGTFGISVTSVNYGEFEQTTIDAYQGTGQTFSAGDLALAVSFARMFTDKFAFGTSVKAVQQRIWEMTSNAIAFDFGTYYNTGWKNVRLAMAIANFGPDALFAGRQLDFTVSKPESYSWPWTITPIPATYKTEKYPLPIIFRFGVAVDLFKVEDKTRLTMAIDLSHFNDVNEKVNFGLEYQFMNFFLRGGYILNTDFEYAKELLWRTGLSFGAGVRVKPVSQLELGIDYAYRDLGRLGISHRLGLIVGFPGPVSAPVVPVITVAPPPPPPPPPPEEIPPEVKPTVVLNPIHFDYDMSAIRPEDAEILRTNAQILKDNPTVKITIEGHCDPKGTAEYNMALGWRRAIAAQEFLVKQGISRDRINIISYGEERLVTENENEYWKNRRCEFIPK